MAILWNLPDILFSVQDWDAMVRNPGIGFIFFHQAFECHKWRCALYVWLYSIYWIFTIVNKVSIIECILKGDKGNISKMFKIYYISIFLFVSSIVLANMEKNIFSNLQVWIFWISINLHRILLAYFMCWKICFLILIIEILLKHQRLNVNQIELYLNTLQNLEGLGQLVVKLRLR